MRVTLAYPYEDHEPDETVDLPDREAQTLLNDGRARLPEDEPAQPSDATGVLHTEEQH